jgi:hypothetical protein
LLRKYFGFLDAGISALPRAQFYRRAFCVPVKCSAYRALPSPAERLVLSRGILGSSLESQICNLKSEIASRLRSLHFP